MSRLLPSLPFLLLAALPLIAQPAGAPRPAAVERAIAIQRAMADARDLLDAHRPMEAAVMLEAQLLHAEGNKNFLDLLRDTYTAELKTIGADSSRSSLVRERLILLGGTLPVASPSLPAPAPAVAEVHDYARDAALAFQKGNWSEASRMFASASKAGKLTPAETAAWDYCRSRSGEPGTVKPTEAEQEPIGTLPSDSRLPAEAADTQPGMIETASFRIRFTTSREVAESMGKAAEATRKTLFERWSGPINGDWEPKCEIVLHASGEAYAKATTRPATGAGHATIRFTSGKVAERKLDLRADDANLMGDSMPRELSHVVLSDLFPMEPPPLWAEAGMAVLAGSAAEAERYSRTLLRCARDGEIVAMASLMEMKEYPEKITGFYCQSVSLVNYLVKLRGERNFTIFLRDSKRYGTASALKKTYDLDGLAGLEREWRRAALSNPRAQAP